MRVKEAIGDDDGRARGEVPKIDIRSTRGSGGRSGSGVVGGSGAPGGGIRGVVIKCGEVWEIEAVVVVG